MVVHLATYIDCCGFIKGFKQRLQFLSPVVMDQNGVKQADNVPRDNKTTSVS